MADERPLPARIWSVEDYYRVKEFYEARGLVFNPALEHGSPAAYHVIAQAKLQRDRNQAKPPGDDLIARLLTGSDDAELSPRELAFLEAYLKQPVPLAQLQQEGREQGRSVSAQRRNKLKLIRDFNRILSAATPAATASVPPKFSGEPTDATPANAAGDDSAPTKAKRCTERGEGRAKLIAALTKQHKYADGGCLNLEPIGNNELARLAGVSESTASSFFNKQFGGHTKYRAICADTTRLLAALKLLNQEFAPHHLFGTKPPDEGEREGNE